VEVKKFRVLVVDDYDAWRSFISSTLERQPRLCIVGQAADGLEALRMIEDLLPDLIVLDIGLPEMNGLEVASRVSQLSPDSKTLMVSETRAPEIAEEAFRRGALGYVVKSAAGGELLPAVDAVLQGMRFIGSELTGSVFLDPKNRSASENHKNVIAAPSPDAKHRPRHEVAFYPDEAAYISGLTRYVETVLKSSDPVIIFAKAAHQASILQRLNADGVDIDALVDRQSVILKDPFESLSAIMVDGRPDAASCTHAIGALIAFATGSPAQERRPVAFCGQCAPVLLSQGNVDGAIQLERLWDEISLSYGADTLCGYISSELPAKNRADVVRRICAEHSVVHGLESSL